MCLSHLIYTLRPCLIHTCHAMLRPCRSSQGHGTAFGFFRLPRGVPRRLLSDAYQSQVQVASVKPNSVCHGRRKEWQQHTTKKDDLLNCWISSSDISGHHADFHEGHGTRGAWQGRGMACVNYRHGMAGEWHGHGMLYVNRP
jgi:hypothetical protein